MTKTSIIKFKQGDDLYLDFTLTDTNHQTAIDLKVTLDAAQAALDVLKAADPLDPAAISAQTTVVDAANTAYEAAILMDITGWGIDSQIRWCGKLIDTFVIDITQAAIGKFILTIPSSSTQLWTPREYDVDIQFTRVSGKISSQTFILDVEKDVTNV